MSYSLVVNKLKQNNNEVWYVLDAYDYKDYLVQPTIILASGEANRENYYAWFNYYFVNCYKSLGLAPSLSSVPAPSLEDFLPKRVFSNVVLTLNELALMPRPDGFVVSLPIPVFSSGLGSNSVLLAVKLKPSLNSYKTIKINNGDELVLVRHECVIEIDVETKKGKKSSGTIRQPVHIYALRSRMESATIDLIDRDEYNNYASLYGAQCPSLSFPEYANLYRIGSVEYGFADWWLCPPLNAVRELKDYLSSRFGVPVKLLFYVVDIDLKQLIANIEKRARESVSDADLEQYFTQGRFVHISLNDFVSQLSSFVVEFSGALFQDYISEGSFLGFTTVHTGLTQWLYEHLEHSNKTYLSSYSGTFQSGTVLSSPAKPYFSQGAVFTPPYVMCKECSNDVRFYSALQCDHGELYYNLTNQASKDCATVHRDLLNGEYAERGYNYKAEIVRQRPQLVLTQHFFKDAIGIFEFPCKSMQKAIVSSSGSTSRRLRFVKFGAGFVNSDESIYNLIKHYLVLVYDDGSKEVLQQSGILWLPPNYSDYDWQQGLVVDLFIIHENSGGYDNTWALCVIVLYPNDDFNRRVFVGYVLGEFEEGWSSLLLDAYGREWEITTAKGTFIYRYRNGNIPSLLDGATDYFAVRFGVSAGAGYYGFSLKKGSEEKSEATGGGAREDLKDIVFFRRGVSSDGTFYFTLNMMEFHRVPYFRNALGIARMIGSDDAVYWFSQFVEDISSKERFEFRDNRLRSYFDTMWNCLIGDFSYRSGLGLGESFAYGCAYAFSTSDVSDYYMNIIPSSSVVLPPTPIEMISQEISDQLAPYYQLFSLYSASKVLQNKTVYLNAFYLTPIEAYLTDALPKVWYPFNWLYHQATYQLTDEEERCCVALRTTRPSFPNEPEGSLINLPSPNSVNTPVYSEELQAPLSSLIYPYTHSSGKFFERIPDNEIDFSLLHKKVPYLSYLQASPFAVITNDAGQWLGEIVKTEQGKYYIVVPSDYADIVSQFIELGFAEYVEKEEGSTVLVIRNPFVLTTILKQSGGKFHEIPNVRIRLVDIS